MGDSTEHIIIDHIINGTSNGEALKGCYFLWVGENNEGLNTYNFHDQSGDPLILGLIVGQPFDFELPQVPDTIWRLTMTGASSTFVGGNFANRPPELPLPQVVGEPDGSYQAQAGGTIVDETSAVTANA